MKKRRFLSLIVAMVMVMSMCLTAVATDNIATLSTGTGDVVTNTETVTITGTSDATSLNLATYQVLYATYDSTKNELTYHLTEWAKSALVDATGVTIGTYTTEKLAIAAIQAITTGGSTTTEQTDIVNTLAAYVISQAGSSPVTQYTDPSFTSWDTTSTAGQATATLPVGAYLVLPSASNMSFLNMLVSVDATAGTDANTWKTTGNGAVLKGKPNGITKYVEEGDTANGATTTAEDVQIGETVTYTVTVDVPQFAKNITNTNIVFKVVDNPDDNISIITGSDYDGITVNAIIDSSNSDTLTKDTDYEVSVDTTGVLTVDLSTNYQTLFCASGTYPYTQVEITYSAKVLSTAAVDTANTNTATLKYGQNLADESDANTAEAKAHVYTYQVVLKKMDDDQTTPNPLEGAKFSIKVNGSSELIQFLYDSTAPGVYTVYDGDTTKVTGDVSVVTELTTASDGTLTIKGLDSGTDYVIYEASAPAGYTLNSSYLKFNITANDPVGGDISNFTKTEYTDGNMNVAVSAGSETWTAGIDGANSYQLDLTLKDTKIASMPSTGSIGIIIFTVLGVCLMIVAVFLMTSSKDSKKKQAQ